MAVDYGAGRTSSTGALYENLRVALANKGRAENLRRAEEIRRQGLFGTGLTEQNLKGMSDIGLGIAEFGEGRMQRQLEQSEKSFDRRQAGLERIYDRYKDATDVEGRTIASNALFNMNRNRHQYEKMNEAYRGKGILGTGMGSESVGYMGEDADISQGRLMKDIRRGWPGVEAAQDEVAPDDRGPRYVPGGTGPGPGPDRTKGIMNLEKPHSLDYKDLRSTISPVQDPATTENQAYRQVHPPLHKSWYTAPEEIPAQLYRRRPEPESYSGPFGSHPDSQFKGR